MKIYISLLMLGCMFLAFPQKQKTYFDSQIDKHLKTYKVKTELAIQNGNKEQAESLFDSLFENHLKHSYARDFSLNKIKGNALKIASLDKAFILITKASWEKITEEEINEVNRMSELYKKQIDIIVLFWDSKSKAKERSKDYDSNVIITYIDERDNDASHIIKPYKHSFGAPACFFFSEEKQLVKINKKFTISSTAKRDDIASNDIHEDIKKMLFENSSSEGLITILN